MPARNLPIQVLSCCDTCGNLQPLRFRFEDREHSVHTVSTHRWTLAKEVY